MFKMLKKTMLLKFVQTIEVPALERFIVKEHFTSEVFYLEDSFKKHFLSKVENPTEKVYIKDHKLSTDALDAKIISRLPSNYVVTLGQLYYLLKSDPDKDSYVAYVLDVNRNVCAVIYRWDSSICCWHVSAYLTTCTNVWIAGWHLLSLCDFEASEASKNGSSPLSDLDSLTTKIDSIDRDVKKLLKHLGAK